MSDTHINAYFGAVDEAKQELVAAKGKLAAAEAALEVKKKETGFVQEKPVVQETSKAVQQSTDSKKK